MTFKIDPDVLVKEQRVVMTEDYRGYQISMATWYHGERPDIKIYKSVQEEVPVMKEVTDEFECCQLGEVDGTIENMRAIMNEIDAKLDKVGIKMKRLDSLPPGSNPFDYDMDRMGMEAGNFMVMWHSTTPEECIVVHVDTGCRVKLDFSELREYYNAIKKMYPIGEAGHDPLNGNPFVLVCTECKERLADYRLSSLLSTSFSNTVATLLSNRSNSPLCSPTCIIYGKRVPLSTDGKRDACTGYVVL